jgi:GAF domain-containing protein
MTPDSGIDEEELRQTTIRKYQLDQQGSEAAFNAVTELASDMFDVPIAIVTVLEQDRQLFRGACGIAGDGTTREDAFCNLTVKMGEVLVIEDAHADPRFRDNPLVAGSPHIRFYAGAPLLLEGDVAIGSLCLIDRVPRTLSVEDRRRLQLLAATVVNLMEFRMGSQLAEQRQQALEHQAELLRATLDNVQQGIGVFDRDLKLMLSNDRLFELLGLDSELFPAGSHASDMLLATARNGGFGAGKPEEIVADLSLSIRAAPSRRLEIIGSEGRILNAWRAAIPDGRFILTLEDVSEQRRFARL